MLRMMTSAAVPSSDPRPRDAHDTSASNGTLTATIGFVVTTLLAIACTEARCPDAPDGLCSARTDGGGVDAPVSCASDTPCTSGYCKDPPGVCVECLENSHCTNGGEPVCDASTNRCTACSEHSECDSKTCLPDGQCALETTVAYVDGDAGNDSGTCTRANACRTLMRAAQLGRGTIKLQGTVNGSAVLENLPPTVIVAEPGTRMVWTGSNGPMLDVRGSSKLSIYDLTIDGALSGASSNGLDLSTAAVDPPDVSLERVKVSGFSGRGIIVNLGRLSLRRSLISDNRGGGIDVRGATAVTIVNNFIVANGVATGTAQSNVGGVSVAGIGDASNSRVSFNTIVANRNSSGSVLSAGLACAAGASLDATGNIVYSNTRGLTNDGTTQVVGGCGFGNTFASGPVAGNLGFDLSANPPIYRLVGTSPATVLDVGGTCPAEDFDGEMRPMNGKCDLGADELKVP